MRGLESLAWVMYGRQAKDYGATPEQMLAMWEDPTLRVRDFWLGEAGFVVNFIKGMGGVS